MTDIKSHPFRPLANSPAKASKSHANPLFLREEVVRQGIEMLFYAYRDFIEEPDEVLHDKGLGRAHHRVIYFVGRYPGMTVSDLLAILRITKQSLSRVLGQLVDEEYIVQKTGPVDRRQRLLELTDKGKELESELTAIQRNRIEAAFREAGAEAVDGFCQVMMGIISDPDDKARF
ncbi:MULTISPECIES: MarR family winged helix-turn-helix transcriptional regulator [Curvivirga]|uniref:MarR family winged helix-turn-helix transcriptional regulator n=1 Tax=Curvivirga TaxID=2856846 RepID=UPI0012BD767E|nr:MarR family transcriptional regulator [Curvivirga aplysinae]MTI10227.1 MarR family transcriptional regulator [Curvivirga aplysinae]